MTRLHVNGATLLRAVAAATANLERHVDEVDALNVFPVPDGDTGSNMLATMRAALAEAERLSAGQRDLHQVADALSRGALAGARGNSGVILSQIIRGMTEGADGSRHANGLHLARGLRKASEAAYGSVLTPVEGTILTVIRDTADAAEAAAGRQPHVEAVLADAIEAAASSVQRTPTLLPVLDDAGVVDSGGQGLYRVLEGMWHVGAPGDASMPIGGPVVDRRSDPHRPPPGIGDVHGYETQYMIESGEDSIDITALRGAVEATGDSVVVAGDAHRARVHVHGERPDLALAAGLAYGRLSQVEVHDLDAQVAHESSAEPTAPGGPARPQDASHRSPTIAVVAACRAPGGADVLSSLGALVVRPAEGRRPSVSEFTEVIETSGAADVIVLPNDRDAVLAAQHAAARVSSANVNVLGTRNTAEGIAAALAFQPDRSIDENAARMAAEASSLRSFAVITAARDSSVDGQRVREGDVLALDADRHLLAMGPDIDDVTVAALSGLGTFEMVTLYLGAGTRPAREASLRERIATSMPDAEIETVDDGDPDRHLLVAVE